MNRKIKLKKPAGSYPKGEHPVECCKAGIPLKKFWRKLLRNQEATLVGVNKSKKSSVKEIAKEEGVEK